MLDTKTIERYKVCPGEELCSQCFWANRSGGYCAGCDSYYQQNCLMSTCDFNCDSCGGGNHTPTFACCGRTGKLYPEWKEWLKSILETPVGNYAPEPLEIKNRVIPVLWHQEPLTHMNIPEEFSEVEVWAAPIREVFYFDGMFRRRNLKEYFNIPQKKKIILSTFDYDNYQEKLWKRRFQLNHLSFQGYGIDYWFPGHFSIYMNYSKLYQFLSAKRQQIHAQLTRSQFVWFELGQNIPLEFLNPIRDAASVLISTSHMNDKDSLSILKNEILTADAWFPKETSFFIVGGTHILPPLTNKRACFEINSNWIMKGILGCDLSGKKSELSKEELLKKNLKEVLNE